MKKISFSIVFLLISAIFILPFVAGQQGEESGITRGELVLWVEALIFIFLIIAIIQNINIVSLFSTSVFGVPFIYILAGTILLGLTRVMYTLYEFRILKIHDETLELWWHLIFYIGILSYLYALNRIISTAKGRKLEGFTKKDLITLVLFGVITFILFISAQPLDAWFISWFDESFADNFGLQHFIAFAFAGFLAAKLFWVRTNMKQEYLGKVMLALIPSFLIFLLLLSLNHFWELLTESWQIIELPEDFIEKTEQLFWLPAFIMLNYGLIKLVKAIKEILPSKQIK